MQSSFFRAVWRWHFYAGLITLPVLAWMALTGALYLYKPELERAFYGGWIEIGRHGEPLPLADLVHAVSIQTGGRVTHVEAPADPGEALRFAVARPDGSEALAFVRADSGLVLGTTAAGGPMEWVKALHSLTVAGPAGNILVEIVAGWAILLVLTGLYLWWPRGAGRALSLAGRVTERRFWRNLHASTGLLAGGILLFLALTGLPWSIFWGAQFHGLVAAQGLGRPAPPVPAPAHHDAHLSWSMRGQPAPVAGASGDIGPDAAVAAATARGLERPWVLTLPTYEGATYRLSAAATRAEDARMIHVDPASGAVLQDVAAADFGPGARAFDWGIYTHQGQQYGEANRLVMLAGCLGVLILALTAPVLWWKRRRGGRLTAPPAPDRRQMRIVAALMLAGGALFPLTGATMVAALAIEAALGRGRRRRAAARIGPAGA